MVYFGGGITTAATGINEQYDPVLNVITPKTSVTARYGLAAGAPGDGMVYFGGGIVSAGTVNEQYDPQRSIYKL